MSAWDKVFSFIKSITPELGMAISTANPAASILVSMVSRSLEADKSNPKDILNKLNSDPACSIKLRKIELDYEPEIMKINSTDYKTEVDDRKNARQREIDLHDWVPTILAIGFLINYAVIQFYCVTHNNTDDIISARFQDVLIMIMSYYFGSVHKRVKIK